MVGAQCHVNADKAPVMQLAYITDCLHPRNEHVDVLRSVDLA